MSVILSKDGGAPGAYALVVDEIPAEQAAQLHTEVTALVFGFTKAKDDTAEKAKLSDTIRQCFGGGHQPQYINAIKFVRIMTDADLKTAKQVVDGIKNVTPSPFPVDF